MRLASVNVGRACPIPNAKTSGKSGIYKQPVDEPVRVGAGGLVGDEISDTENHGGLDQAVYVFGTPDYDWWSEELGRGLPPGTFGENLTITELESAELCIGDRLVVGPVVLEVTAPRIPCVTLAARMEDPLFVKHFRRAERPGLYCRVIQEGQVQAGERVSLVKYPGEKLPAVEMFRDSFDPDLSEKTIRRHLAAPIAVRARVDKEKQLGEIMACKEKASIVKPAERVWR